MRIKKINEAISRYLKEDIEKRKLDVNIDTSKGILVDTDSTVFAHYTFKELKDDIEDKWKELRSLTRVNKIKLSGSKNAQEAIQLLPEYKEAVETWNKTVTDLQKEWTKVVQDGIYAPTSDDKRLDELAEKGWKIEKLFNLNQPAGKYLTTYRHIEQALETVKDTLRYPDERKLLQVGV